MESVNYDKANKLSSHLGEAWHEAEKGLAAMSAAEGAHEPAVDSSLEADLKFVVGHSLGLLWEALKPKLRVRRVPLNTPAIEAAYSKFATVAAVRARRGSARLAAMGELVPTNSPWVSSWTSSRLA